MARSGTRSASLVFSHSRKLAGCVIAMPAYSSRWNASTQLNAQHLVEERKERSVLEEVLDKTPALVKNLGLAIETVNALRQSKDLMIPPIPAPPISAVGATSL